MEITDIIKVDDPFIISTRHKVTYSWEHYNSDTEWCHSDILMMCKIKAYGYLNGERVAIIKRLCNNEKEHIIIKTKELRRIGWFNEYNHFKKEPITLNDYKL